MATYRLTRNYKSSRTGNYTAGAVMELDAATVAWLEAEAPGLLESVGGRALLVPQHDRMMRGPTRTRREPREPEASEA